MNTTPDKPASGPTCPRCASWRVQRVGVNRWCCSSCQKRWSRKPTNPERPPALAPATGSTNYDSRPETIEHILRVRELLYITQNKLEARGFAHDQTKLGPNEKPIFDRVTGKLKGLTYGSDEYKASLKDLGPALAHHYANNSHHPEHYTNGVDGMSLLDVIEMLCDWKAAGERHADGSITRSLTVNRGRFKISDQLHAILENTVRELGWSNDQAQTRRANDMRWDFKGGSETNTTQSARSVVQSQTDRA